MEMHRATSGAPYPRQPGARLPSIGSLVLPCFEPFSREMNFLSRIMILSALLSLAGCGDGDKLWEDGNYRVYARPNSREIIMGYHFGDGAVLGLSDPTVTAAGADARHVVFQVNGASHFYIVREEGGEGTTHGPYDVEAFEAIRRELALPSFEWHLRR